MNRLIRTASVLGAVAAIALVAFATGTGPAATPAEAGTPPPNISLNGSPSVPTGSTGNTVNIQITGLPGNLGGYSVVGTYNEAIIDITAVADISGIPSPLCPLVDDDPIAGPPGDFEATCGGTPGNFVAGPTVQLARLTFSCLANGSTAITFTTSDASDSNFVQLDPTDTPGTITCTGGAAPPTPTNTATPTATATPCPGGGCPTATPTSVGAVRSATPTRTPTPEGGVPPTQTPGGGGGGTTPPPSSGTTTPGGGPGGVIQPPSTGSGDGTSETTLGVMIALAIALVGAGATGTGYALKKRRARS